MIGWFVYLVTILDKIKMTVSVISIITLVMVCTMLFSAFMFFINGDDSPFGNKSFTKCFKSFVIILIIFGSIDVITPNTKEMVAIYLVPKIVNNENCQQLPDNIIKLFNQKLEQWFEESIGATKTSNNNSK